MVEGVFALKSGGVGSVHPFNLGVSYTPDPARH